MAIDSKAKRSSCFGCGLAFRVVLPDPDGTVGAGDAQALLALYRSATGGFAPPPPAPGGVSTPTAALIEVDAPIATLL